MDHLVVMDDASELGAGDSGVESITSNEVGVTTVVSIPELNLQKTFQFNQEETVWKAKQHILSCIGKNLKDGFNYSFYCPPMNRRAGKFLDEERLLKEYSLPSSTGCLEFKMKRRLYKSFNITAKRAKQLHSKGNVKQLMEHVKKAETDRILKLLNRGMDPNFIETSTGETPLTASCSSSRSSSVIVTLFEGGAYLDFRNKRGHTPLHVAAQKGNEAAIKILLDLGSSANYKDLHGLTPLYLGACCNATASCIGMLLYDHAVVDTADERGWTELHQSCKAGLVQNVELLMYYGADLNKQNCSGNTPLHISVLNNQEECARALMFRGADRSILNYANKSAYDCVMVSGNSRLAEVIQNFSDADIVLYQDAPSYNDKRRSLHPIAFGALKRCRSNPLINSSANYETINIVEHSKSKRTDSLWDAQQNLGASTLGRPERRFTALPDLSAFNELNSSAKHPFIRTYKRSLSISSADSSQAEGEMFFEQNKCGSIDARYPQIRHVTLVNDSSDFGFILRGAKADTTSSDASRQFIPTPSQPALQYFEKVNPQSLADEAGVRPGDFLLEINGTDVTSASHEHTVSLIRSSTPTVEMMIMTPRQDYLCFYNTIDSKKRINGVSTDLSSLESKNLSSFKMLPLPLESETSVADQKVASIRPVHGKRLVHDLPKNDHDDVKVVSVPSYNGNSLSRRLLWKAKSVQSISEVDNICYMFGEGAETPICSSSSQSRGFLSTFESHQNKKIESKEFKVSSPKVANKFCTNQTAKSSSDVQDKRCNPELSSFIPFSKSRSNLMNKCKEVADVQLHRVQTINGGDNPPTPPPLPAYKTLNHPLSYGAERNETLKREKDLNFLALAENARQVFLKHHKQHTTDSCSETGDVACDVERKDFASTRNVDEKYVSGKFGAFGNSREFSKPGLVSNMRQIFECNADARSKTKLSVESHNAKNTKNDVSTLEKVERSSPIRPKPLQKPSNATSNNHFIPNDRTSNPGSVRHSDVCDSDSMHSGDITGMLPSPIADANSLMNSSLNSDDSLSFIPPPPGFEDFTDSASPAAIPSVKIDISSRNAEERRSNRCNNSNGCIEFWTVDDVAAWLEMTGMGEHGRSFVDNNVDGKKLSTLGRNGLISLGVVQVGQRMNIERAIKKMLISYSNP